MLLLELVDVRALQSESVRAVVHVSDVALLCVRLVSTFSGVGGCTLM